MFASHRATIRLDESLSSSKLTDRTERWWYVFSHSNIVTTAVEAVLLILSHQKCVEFINLYFPSSTNKGFPSYHPTNTWQIHGPTLWMNISLGSQTSAPWPRFTKPSCCCISFRFPWPCYGLYNSVFESFQRLEWIPVQPFHRHLETKQVWVHGRSYLLVHTP